MKFVLLVEGSTEKGSAAAFLKRWLDPRLTRPVGIKAVVHHGYANLIGKMEARVRAHLEGPKNEEIVAVIALLDLYGPDFFPSQAKTTAQRHRWGVDYLKQTVQLPRFEVFFAVHEFEAWLLSEPEIFPSQLQDSLYKISQPEKVDLKVPPSKMLDNLYQKGLKRGYKKTTYGKQLFARLDPDQAVQKCPYLKKMLEEMLRMAKAAGL